MRGLILSSYKANKPSSISILWTRKPPYWCNNDNDNDLVFMTIAIILLFKSLNGEILRYFDLLISYINTIYLILIIFLLEQVLTIQIFLIQNMSINLMCTWTGTFANFFEYLAPLFA